MDDVQAFHDGLADKDKRPGVLRALEAEQARNGDTQESRSLIHFCLLFPDRLVSRVENIPRIDSDMLYKRQRQTRYGTPEEDMCGVVGCFFVTVKGTTTAACAQANRRRRAFRRGNNNGGGGNNNNGGGGNNNP